MENVRNFDPIAREAGLTAPTRLFRPPYGRITRAQMRQLADHRIIMWDVLSQDYNRSLTPAQCLRRSRAATRPGSIVVFHDSYKAERNMTYTLPRLIDHLRTNGYTFGTF